MARSEPLWPVRFVLAPDGGSPCCWPACSASSRPLVVCPGPGTRVRRCQRPGHTSRSPCRPSCEGVDLLRQTSEEAAAKSAGCVACHDGARDPHRARRPSDSAASIATAATRTPQSRKRPTFCRAFPALANVRQPGPLVHPAQPRVPRSSSASSTPATCASPTSAAARRAAIADEVLQNRKSMMTHGCMLWGAALYNNGSVPFKMVALRRELQHERRAAAPADRPAADATTRLPRRASCRSSTRCPASRSSSRATSCASSSAAAGSGRRSAFPNPSRNPGEPRTGLATAAWAPRTAPIPSSSACRKRGCSTRRSTSWAPTTIPATIAPAAAPPAT